MLLLASLLLTLAFQEPDRSSSFRFAPFDSGLPRTAQWRHGFAVADMNGDGRPDLALTSPRKQAGPPVIFLNEGGGRWSKWAEAKFPSLPFDYGAVAAADFNRDGATDLAIACHYRGVTVVTGDGRGSFVSWQEGMTFPTSSRESAPFSSRAAIATDWNGDGWPDVAALSDGPRPGVEGVQLGVTIYQNLGAGWIPVRATGAPDRVFGDHIAAGDVDGDGLPDLVTASHESRDLSVVRLGGGGALERRRVETLLTPSVIRAVDVHDFDADGRDEIVLGYSTSASPRRAVIELLSMPAGSREPRQLWSGELAETGDVTAVAAGDVNGDGATDVVAALQDGRLLTFRGDGGGFVTRDTEIAPPEWRRGCYSYAIRLADLDADGRDELIATFAGESTGCPSGGGIEVWRIAPPARRQRAVRH